jgi:Flp pilus assembly protein TadD
MWVPEHPIHLGIALAAAALLTLAGCADLAVAPGESPRASARDRARVGAEALGGFTVTEVVRIDSGTRSEYQRAIALLNRNRAAEGIALLESVTAEAPELASPQIDLAVAYRSVRRFDDSVQRLTGVLERTPDHPMALNELGITYRHMGRLAEARTSYERALTVIPGYHYALRNLGVLCDLYLNDLRCALEQYEHYSALVADDPDVDMWIADVKTRIGAAEGVRP